MCRGVATIRRARRRRPPAAALSIPVAAAAATALASSPSSRAGRVAWPVRWGQTEQPPRRPGPVLLLARRRVEKCDNFSIRSFTPF